MMYMTHNMGRSKEVTYVESEMGACILVEVHGETVSSSNYTPEQTTEARAAYIECVRVMLEEE